MAVENITLNLIPTGDTPSIHVAQFDVDRPFTVTLKEGEDDFTPTGYTIELQVRKVDSTIVTVAPSSSSGNVVTFNTTEQMTACSGTNLAELQLTKDSQTFATLHFYLVVQRDVLAGGVTSESDIYNLTEQIAEIVPEVIGDDYYTKEEVDEIIEDIPTFDPTNYYDKSETDTLLNDKADVSDLPDMTNYYDKSETNTLLSAKADTSSLSPVATTGDYDDLTNKPTIPIIETATIENTAIATFTDGADNVPVKSLTSEIVAVENGSGTKSPTNPYTISGFSSGVVTVTDNDQITNTYTFAFGQTVYGGHFDNKGNLVVTYAQTDINSAINNRTTSYDNPVFYGSISGLKPKSNNSLCECFNTINGQASASSFAIVSNNNDFAINSANTGDTIQVFLRADEYTDVASLKSTCGSSKIKYELANPITLAITSQHIPTLLGDNNIFSDTGDINKLVYFKTGCESIAALIEAYM